MTNEQNFKKGDRVRVAIKDWRMSVDMGNDVGAIMTGDVGVVTGPSYDGDLIEVAFCDGWVRHDFGKDEIELVESYDRRTDFLRRLGALLREFDAEIIAHIGEDDKTHTDKPLMYIQIGDEVVNYENWLDLCEITADNIMDFDKE